MFNHIENIGLWKKEEYLFFLSFVFSVTETYYLFFSFNFWQFSEDIRLGNLDFILLKPVHSLFITRCRVMAIAGIVTILLTYTLMIYFGSQLKFSFLTWCSIPFCLLLSILLLLGIENLISLLNFFTIEGYSINEARIQIQHAMRWPDAIYKNPIRFFILPILTVTSIPVRWVLDIQYWNWLIIMLIGTFIIWSLVLLLWPKCLDFYESSSS